MNTNTGLHTGVNTDVHRGVWTGTTRHTLAWLAAASVLAL